MSAAPDLDPDRFLDDGTPGSHEWWYFDALGDDGRDALVVILYAALPFDPSYGVATLRHLRHRSRHPAPDPLDHCAVGISWYRDGRTLAYALNGYRRPDFAHRAAPFRVAVAGNTLDRDGDGYLLRVDTPAVDGRHRVRADLRFRPAARTVPFERDLGSPGSPHRWMLAAADCRVAGRVALDGPRGVAADFAGRGYHDHNAGAEEIRLGFRRWSWGRAHLGDLTHVYYLAEPRHGEARSLWITLRDGEPATIRDSPAVARGGWRRNRFGIRSDATLTLDGALRRTQRVVVDDGPFYRRWIADFAIDGGPTTPGIAELLETSNLHRPWFNWMIPYRLKRPGADGSSRGLSPADATSRLD